MRTHKLSLAISLVVATSNAYSQTSPPGGDQYIEEVLVISTGTGVKREAFNTPLTVNTLDENALRKTSFNSQADILATIPGLKAEGGGGEVATNIQIRGLPSTGQYQFTPLNYDGVPLFSTFGLNSSAFDFYGRNDLGIERLEFVKGGVSNLFGPGSVAGIINYISKTGTDETEGALQLEYAEEGRRRADFAVSGPVSESTFYALSGFYRYDEGPIKTGNVTDGFQLKGNLRHEFDDGSGDFTVYGQYIDDRVQFFLPLTLDGRSLERIRGNDGTTLYSHNTSYIAGARVQSPEGITDYSAAADGFTTTGGSIYVIVDKELDDDWSLNFKAKYADYKSQSNFFNAGDGIVNFPETQEEYLTERGLGDLANAQFTYADTGTPIDADAQLFANRFNMRDRPATDATFELNLTRAIDLGNATHNFTFGTFFSRAEASNIQRTVRYLGELNDNARLINLVINPGTTNEFVASYNGITDAVLDYNNQVRSQTREAFYIADQIEWDRLLIDVGVRWESTDVTNVVEGKDSFAINNAGGAAATAGLSNVTFGNGSFQRGTASTHDFAASVGALYKLTDSFNLYGNASRGFFFPQAQGLKFNPETGRIGSFEPETINMIEFGVKSNGSHYSWEAATFYVTLDDRQQVQFVNDPITGQTVEQITELSTEAVGIEANGSYDINDYISLNGNFILQNHEISESADPTIEGKELQRKPNEVVNLGIDVNVENIDFSLQINHQGRAFGNDANTSKLPSFQYLNLNLGYSIDVGNEDSFRIGLSVFNVTDEQGLQEGNPRFDQDSNTAPEFVSARPILPRRYTVKLTYDF